MMRSSKRYSPSVPGSPGCAKRGVWRRAVAKLRLPNPPRPPLHKTNCWPCVVRSATSLPLFSMPSGDFFGFRSSLLKSISNADFPCDVRISGRLPVLVLKIGFSLLRPLPRRHPGHFFFDRRRGVREPPDERAAGNFDDQIFSRVAVHALAHAVLRRPGAMRRGT